MRACAGLGRLGPPLLGCIRRVGRCGRETLLTHMAIHHPRKMKMRHRRTTLRPCPWPSPPGYEFVRQLGWTQEIEKSGADLEGRGERKRAADATVAVVSPLPRPPRQLLQALPYLRHPCSRLRHAGEGSSARWFGGKRFENRGTYAICPFVEIFIAIQQT
jgi:hypothetical protein